MKVLFLNQVYYPDRVATAQHLTDLAHYVSQQGHYVTVICDRRNYEKRSLRYPRYSEYQRVKVMRVASTGFGKKSVLGRVIDSLTFEISLCWKLLWMPRQDVTVTFTSPPLLGILGVLFCKLKGGQCVQWLMDLNPDAAIRAGFLKASSWVARLLSFVARQTLVQSDNVVVLDRWMKERVLQYGVSEEKILIIAPWPVHQTQERKSKASQPNSFAKQYGLESKFIVLYSGNHSILHPVDTLLSAALELKNESEVLFLFIGGGVREKDVREFKAKHKLQNIKQLPRQPRESLELTLSAAGAHVVVMGKQFSGVVHVSKIYGVLETGKPFITVAPEQSHLSDLKSLCPNSFHVRHGQVKKFVQAINEIRKLSDRQKEEVYQTNRRLVAQRFSPDRCMRIFVEAILSQTPKKTSVLEQLQSETIS